MELIGIDVLNTKREDLLKNDYTYSKDAYIGLATQNINGTRVYYVYSYYKNKLVLNVPTLDLNIAIYMISDYLMEAYGIDKKDDKFVLVENDKEYILHK